MKPAFCKHIRSKKMYVGTKEETLAELTAGQTSGHFWCNLTQTVVGPDDQQASPHACDASRNCYKPGMGSSGSASA